MLGLHKRNASRLPCLPNKRNRHFIRDVERLDQNRFIALESDGIFYQEFRELIEPDVVHKRLSFHQPRRMQLRGGTTRFEPVSPQNRHRNRLETEANTLLLAGAGSTNDQEVVARLVGFLPAQGCTYCKQASPSVLVVG